MFLNRYISPKFIIQCEVDMPDVVILRGGLLIDGNWGEPISDSSILIESGKITGVESKIRNTPVHGVKVIDCGDSI